MSSVPQSTVGYERRFNWALGVADEPSFVRQVLSGQPEPPRYFAEMKRINRVGPPLLGGLSLPERIAEHRLASLLASGAVIVDLRSAADFAAGHIPGTLNLPFNKSFTTWAGSLLPYDRELYLLLDGDGAALEAAIQQLLVIGLDRVGGYFTPDALALWAAEHALQGVDQLAVGDLASRRNGLIVLDVRGRSEWEAGHVPGATLIPLAELPDRLGELPDDRPIAVHCQGGSRSAIAASLLLARGRRHVANVAAGFGAWLKEGLPIER
jgi:hydroxyacylglutathione hydrolase